MKYLAYIVGIVLGVAALTVRARLFTTPNQVHVALAGRDANGNHNGMAVSWQTQKDTSSSTVLYGTTPGRYTSSATGYSAVYYETFHHHVVLENLRPNTQYYYQVGDALGGWSQEFSFKSAPLSEGGFTPFTFAYFADLGVVHGESSISFLKQIQNNISLIWHGGDISYADDSFLHKGCLFSFCYEEVWDEYMNEIEPFASRLPYMTAPGNHEAECHDPACLADADRRAKLSNFTAYNTRFRMPSKESNSGAMNMHFSFNYGPVHYISIDTETGYPGASEEKHYVLPCGGFEEQLQWLENDLIEASKHRDVRPWIFVAGHHPMYQGDSINKEFQAAMEGLFNKYQVDAYFCGHKHSYERTYPVYQGVPQMTYVNPSYTTHFMVGGAGNDEMDAAQSKKPVEVLTAAEKERKEASNEGQGLWRASEVSGSWTAVVDKEYLGISTVQILSANELRFNYYRTSSGELFDTITLTRDHSKMLVV
jgi:hypothetical protein